MDLQKVKHLLPESIQQIVLLLGYPATLQLIEQLGGVTFPFGKGASALGEQRVQLLTDCVGNDNARKLMQHFGGEDLYIPRCAAALRELRNRQFIADFNQLRSTGVSALMAMTELCPRYGFSDRFAWGLLSHAKRERRNDYQDDLF